MEPHQHQALGRLPKKLHSGSFPICLSMDMFSLWFVSCRPIHGHVFTSKNSRNHHSIIDQSLINGCLPTQDFGDYQDGYYSVQTTEGEQIAQLIAGYIDIILKKVSNACVCIENATHFTILCYIGVNDCHTAVCTLWTRL